MTFQEVPKNFDPNSIPADDSTEDDIQDQVTRWFEQRDEDQDTDSGDQGSVGEGVGDSSSTPPPPPASATAVDADTYEDPFAGVEPQARLAYARFLAWASQDESRLAAIDAFWRGEAQLVARDQPAAPTSTPAAQPVGQTPSQQAPQSGTLPAPIQEMQDKLEAVATVTRHVYQDYQQRQSAETSNTLDTVKSEVQKQFSLTDEQLNKLTEAAAATNLAATLTQQYGISKGLHKLFETTMAMEPEFRSILVEREAADKTRQQERTRKQAALAGSSGSVTRSPANPPQTGRGTRLTNPERTAAMAQMVAAAQGASDQ